MGPRLNYPTISPEPMKLMYAMEKYLGGSGLERKLIELVKIRASQINGCAYCIDMHTQDARAEGETGDAVLHGPGAGGAGVDRGSDPD